MNRSIKESERGNFGVCARRVPDLRKTRSSSTATGNDIERDDLVYSVNEPDNYAVEEALQIAQRDRAAKSPSSPSAARTTRRSCAARWPWAPSTGSCSRDAAFDGSDGRGIATILKAFVEKGNYDLILTGVQAEDGAAQVGGMLAAMLDYPFASLVNSIEVLDGRRS